jgi:hypothetical protein
VTSNPVIAFGISQDMRMEIPRTQIVRMALFAADRGVMATLADAERWTAAATLPDDLIRLPEQESEG